MKVAVIGATGRTGAHLVSTLLERGHEVSALVRDPARLPDSAAETRVVSGSSTDPAAVAALLEGAEAVVSALGPREGDATLHQRTAEVLVTAMAGAGITRFVGISGAGVDVPGDRKSPRDRLISWMIQRVGGAVVKDKPAEYEVWAQSGLDFTLVRPPRLQDRPGTGRLEHAAHTSPKSTTLSRADLAAFLVDVLEQHLYVGQAPLVANRRG